MKYGILLLIFLVSILTIVPGYAATFSIDDIAGDPVNAIEPVEDPVKWIVGLCIGAFLVVSFMGLVLSGSAAQTGAAIKSATMRQQGMQGVVFVVVIVSLVAISMLLFLYVVNTFLLS